jgi:hypothetical protein
LLTYAVICVGLAGGIVQCYFNYVHAQLDKKPLCLVMEENFDSEDSVFGQNGSFSREVNMDGFGYVASPSLQFHFCTPSTLGVLRPHSSEARPSITAKPASLRLLALPCCGFELLPDFVSPN